MSEEKKMPGNVSIENPKRRIVEDLKIRNKDNMEIVAGEYFGNQYSYAQTFEMFEDFKKAFIHIDGLNKDTVTISTPSTIASVNAFYGALDANKVLNMTSPGFLHAYTEKYTKQLNSKTVVIYDGFLSDDLISKFHATGIKNIIIMSITDYMNPIVKVAASKNGIISDKDYLDEYAKRHHFLPQGMEMIRMEEFAKIGSKIKETYDFEYEENQLAAYFLTGATTSQFPKCVKVSADGFTKMASIFDHIWFDYKSGSRYSVLIPMFYATGAVHNIYTGLVRGLTMIYQPKYDRFAFAKDLADSKANIVLATPSHVATLNECDLADNALSHVKYIFIGGEAILPAQMEKFRKSANRLGIKYIINGYGMTETASMTSVSDKESVGDDVTVSPIPGVEYRIVNPVTREVLPDNTRGILEKKSPCASLGYFEEEMNKSLFTEDGWINTGDVAIRYSNGKYRIFGRSSDSFTNSGVTYAMYDIEEQALKHPDVAEAEVVKFTFDGEEYPAMVVVLNSNATDRIADITKELCTIDVAGMEHFIGIRYVDKFKTNPVTSKRDYLSLQNDTTGYYSVINGKYYCQTVGQEKKSINKEEITIINI